jgi:hypothetical protein
MRWRGSIVVNECCTKVFFSRAMTATCLEVFGEKPATDIADDACT